MEARGNNRLSGDCEGIQTVLLRALSQGKWASHAGSECNDDCTEGDDFLQSYFRGVSILARFRKNCVCSSGMIPAKVQNASSWTNYTSVVSAGEAR